MRALRVELTTRAMKHVSRLPVAPALGHSALVRRRSWLKVARVRPSCKHCSRITTGWWRVSRRSRPDGVAKIPERAVGGDLGAHRDGQTLAFTALELSNVHGDVVVHLRISNGGVHLKLLMVARAGHGGLSLIHI